MSCRKSTKLEEGSTFISTLVAIVKDMTVSYSREVFTGTGGGIFLRLLFRWNGSIYKLIIKELAFYMSFFFVLSFTYRFLLNENGRHWFENVALYCGNFANLIPVTFVLGFYVSVVITRWWQQFESIPWPDSQAIWISHCIHGNDERARLMRRTIMRYLNLSLILTLRLTCLPVKKRFPTLDHLVESGILEQGEKKIIEAMDEKASHPKYWMPLVWAGSIISRARKEGRIPNDYVATQMLEKIDKFRGLTGGLLNYDWITVPLVYTQVVTLAVYTFLLSNLMGTQFLDPAKKFPNHEADLYFPVFTFLQFFFYMGWLKVAEVLINPFGEDDEDFEINWIIDRNFQVSYLIVDEMHEEFPRLIKDHFWDELFPEIPYTLAAEDSRCPDPRIGAAADIEIPESEAEFVYEASEEAEKRGSLREVVISNGVSKGVPSGLLNPVLASAAFTALPVVAPHIRRNRSTIGLVRQQEKKRSASLVPTVLDPNWDVQAGSSLKAKWVTNDVRRTNSAIGSPFGQEDTSMGQTDRRSPSAASLRRSVMRLVGGRKASSSLLSNAACNRIAGSNVSLMSRKSDLRTASRLSGLKRPDLLGCRSKVRNLHLTDDDQVGAALDLASANGEENKTNGRGAWTEDASMDESDLLGGLMEAPFIEGPAADTYDDDDDDGSFSDGSISDDVTSVLAPGQEADHPGLLQNIRPHWERHRRLGCVASSNRKHLIRQTVFDILNRDLQEQAGSKTVPVEDESGCQNVQVQRLLCQKLELVQRVQKDLVAMLQQPTSADRFLKDSMGPHDDCRSHDEGQSGEQTTRTRRRSSSGHRHHQGKGHEHPDHLDSNRPRPSTAESQAADETGGPRGLQPAVPDTFPEPGPAASTGPDIEGHGDDHGDPLLLEATALQEVQGEALLKPVVVFAGTGGAGGAPGEHPAGIPNGADHTLTTIEEQPELGYQSDPGEMEPLCAKSYRLPDKASDRRNLQTVSEDDQDQK